MRLCVPTVEDRGAGSVVSGHFGSAPYFAIADTDAAPGGVRIVPNPGCLRHRGVCHHVPILRAHRVEAVACSGIGRQAHADLTGAGIRVIRTPAVTVAGVLDAVGDGTAAPMSPGEACGGGRRIGCGERRHGHR